MFLPAVAGPVDPGTDPALLSSVLTLSDVFCTGHHCAVKAGVGPRTSVTVIGDGTHTVPECVGTRQALETAFGVVRDGGVVSRVGVPHYTEGPVGFDMVMRNLTLTGGTVPAGPTSSSCCPTCSSARSSPASCSTAPSASTR